MSTLKKSDLETNASISARNLLRHRAKSHDEAVIMFSSEKNAEILLKVSLLKLERIQKMTVSDFSKIGMERYNRLVKKEKYLHGKYLIDFKFKYSDLEINSEKMLGSYREGWGLLASDQHW
ncbi:5881_t:CDS:2 [Diversispora eburnea]|uniref:5881_t:CDS:1 n=1 Tax=Diversispora eburnea TaxID=1213867 RepID=A0A9N8ZA46_9GLOM|nr:5881_t:CDS:2 [Diversispora eburnea]